MFVDVVCLGQKTFPRSILTRHLHLIVHLVDEITLFGTVHAWWMFLLEHFMTILKGIVRQNGRLEGSMDEGLLIQESLVHVGALYMAHST